MKCFGTDIIIVGFRFCCTHSRTEKIKGSTKQNNKRQNEKKLRTMRKRPKIVVIQFISVFFFLFFCCKNRFFFCIFELMISDYYWWKMMGFSLKSLLLTFLAGFAFIAGSRFSLVAILLFHSYWKGLLCSIGYVNETI